MVTAVKTTCAAVSKLLMKTGMTVFDRDDIDKALMEASILSKDGREAYTNPDIGYLKVFGCLEATGKKRWQLTERAQEVFTISVEVQTKALAEDIAHRIISETHHFGQAVEIWSDVEK